MKKTILFSILAMAFMSLTLFTSCSDNSPSGVVKTYYSAMKRGNAEKAAKCLDIPAERLPKRIERFEQQFQRDDANMYLIKNGSVKILEENIDGDRASVEVSVGADGMGIQLGMNLVKVNGEWKIIE